MFPRPLKTINMNTHLLSVHLQSGLTSLGLLGVDCQLAAQLVVAGAQLGDLLLRVHLDLLQVGLESVGVSGPGLLQNHLDRAGDLTEGGRTQQGPQVSRGRHL